MAAALPQPEGSQEDFDGFLEEFAWLSSEDSLEATLARGVEVVARLEGAGAAGLFLVDRDQILTETWHPTGDALCPERKSELRRAAARALTRSTPEADLVLATPKIDIRFLRLRNQLIGAVCFESSAAPDSHAGAQHTARLETLLHLLALRIRSQRESARYHAELARHERWFKTMDRQLQILDRERQKFAAVMNEGDVCVFVADPSGRVQWANKAALDSLPPEAGGSSWVGETCRDACGRFGQSGGRTGCAECAVSRAVASREKAYEELRREGDGPARDFLLTALPIRSPDGTAQEILLRVQDLTDLHVLRQSESRYRLLFERSTNAILMIDLASHRVLLANGMATRMFGYPSSELAGLPLADLHTPSGWEAARAQYVRAIEGRESGSFESSLQTRDGRESWATASVSRIELQGREVAMVELRDVTERKRVEEALRTTERRLETVVANAPVVLFAIERSGRITLSQGRGLAALGRASGELEGKNFYELYQEFPDAVRNFERALSGEEFTAVVEMGRLAFETRYRPVFGEGGITGIIGVAIDVTERKELEEQLRQSHKMEAIGRLAGGVAHEFNNLLTIILGHSEMLMGRSAPGTPLRKDAEEIYDAGSRGAWLARQLLAFGRQDLYAPSVLDLNDVIADLETMLRRLINEDVQLVTRPSPTPATVKADRGHIEQVIMNLVLNARDAMPQGGRLTIELSELDWSQTSTPSTDGSRVGRFVRLGVSDTGCGMSEEVRARIFEPFFTTKGRGGSAGLGLCIVYGIVQQSGGEIEVSSTVGEGTAVCVYLPLVEAEQGSGTQRADGTPGSQTVLLAEDEDAVRDLLRDMLEMGGYRVLAARSGVDALTRVEKSADAIDLLVTDVVMPQMGGGELAQRLTALRPGVRVLFVSGYPDDSFVRQGVIDAGAPFLQKPFSFEVLLHKVREVLATPAR